MKIVFVAGDPRFEREIRRAEAEETRRGNAVVTMGVFPCVGDASDMLELSLKKVSFSDELLVVNPGLSLDRGTTRLVREAKFLGKRVRWAEHPGVVPASLIGLAPSRCDYVGVPLVRVVEADGRPVEHPDPAPAGTPLVWAREGLIFRAEVPH